MTCVTCTRPRCSSLGSRPPSVWKIAQTAPARPLILAQHSAAAAERLGLLIDHIGLSLPSDGAPQAEPATEKVA
jgi:hypothetical protein